MNILLWIRLLLVFAGIFRCFGSLENVNIECGRHTQSNCGDKQSHNAQKTIYFGLMLSFPEGSSHAASYDDGHNLAPAAYLAVQQINERSDLLQDYKIKILRFDGGCESYTRTILGINKLYCSCENIVGIIGPSCEQSSRTVSELTNRKDFSMITVNYGVRQESVGKHPYSFGILGTHDVYNGMVVELVKVNNWTNTALLYYGLGEYYRMESDELTHLLQASGFSVMYQSAIYDTFIPLKQVKESFARVIILSTTDELYVRILCMAYHEKMVFPHYQWIFQNIVHPTGNISFNYGGQQISCSEAEIMTALHGSIYPILNAFEAVQYYSKLPTSTGYSAAEFYTNYRLQTIMYSEQFAVNSHTSLKANAIYDAVWVMAFALNDTLVDLNISLTDIDLGSGVLAESVRRRLLKTSILGTTGSIKFDNIGFNKQIVLNIYQYSKAEAKKIAVYANEMLTFSPNVSHTFIPSFDKHYKQINLGVATTIFILTTITLGLVITAQIANIYYRTHKVIKASSPMLNHLIFLGCHSIAFGVIFLTLGSFRYPNLDVKKWMCNLAPGLLNIGASLLLGTVCLKTWRLNRIYAKSKKLVKGEIKCMKTYSLAGLVSIFVVTDVILCILWGVLDPLTPTPMEHFGIVNNNPSIITEDLCQSQFSLIWALTPFVPKVLLSLASFALALSTHFRIRELKTNNVIILTYCLAVVYGLAIPLYVIFFIVELDVTVRVALMCICFNLSVCISVIALFLPFIDAIKRRHVHTSQSST